MPPEELQSREQPNDTFEMESQFILRLPHLPAASLKAAVKSGVQNLKDRLSIQLDPDIRNGKVRFDGWVLPAKIVDLPTIRCRQSDLWRPLSDKKGKFQPGVRAEWKT